MLVPGRKSGFLVKIKGGDNFDRWNTGRILRIKISRLRKKSNICVTRDFSEFAAYAL